MIEEKMLVHDGIGPGEFARIAGASYSTVMKYVRNGTIPYVRKEELIKTTKYTLSRTLAMNMRAMGWQKAIEEWRKQYE